MSRTVVIVLLIAILLVGGMGRFLLAGNFGYAYDVEEFRSFAQKVVSKGAFELYVPDEKTDINYPPLLIWALAGASSLFGGMGEEELPQFKLVLAGMLTAADLGFCLVLFFLALPLGRPKALAASALWAFNPQSIWDTGYWAQLNPYIILLTGLAVLMIVRQRWFWGCVMFALACLIKPQPWALAPMLLLWVFRESRWKGAWKALLGMILPVLLVWFGFLLAGRAPTLRLMFTALQANNNYISFNGHNLWWIWEALSGGLIRGGKALLPGFSYAYLAQIVAGIMLLLLGLAWIKRWWKEKGNHGVEMLALWSGAVFLFSPYMHENHAMLALSLIMCAWAMGRKVGWQLWLATMLILSNCLLHDETILGGPFAGDGSFWTELVVLRGREQVNISPLTTVLAAASVILWMWWALSYLWRRKTNSVKTV